MVEIGLKELLVIAVLGLGGRDAVRWGSGRGVQRPNKGQGVAGEWSGGWVAREAASARVYIRTVGTTSSCPCSHSSLPRKARQSTVACVSRTVCFSAASTAAGSVVLGSPDPSWGVVIAFGAY